MKKTFLILIFLCAVFTSSARAQSIELPEKCKQILDANFQGWQLAEIQKEIIEYHQEKNFPFAPNLIKGDWNGDGKTDYAVLIKQGELKNPAGENIGERRFTIAFVKTKNGFKYFQFDGGDSISLMKKGTTDYDYETDKKFRYKTDAIFDGFWEKAGVSYVWKNGKFIQITTSD